MASLRGKGPSTSRSAKQIVVVRALKGLGDLLCIIPAMRALRLHFPHARISLIGLPTAQFVVQRFPQYLDELIDFPSFPGIPERSLQVELLPEFLARMQQRHFDLALQMHGSGLIVNSFTLLLGAKKTAGFYLPSMYCPDPDYFMPYPADEPEVRRNLRLLEFLGIPLQGDSLEFPLTQDDQAELTTLEIAHHLKPGEYVCVHPGASDASRRWSPKFFASVADALSVRGFDIVLTGTEGEVNIANQVAQAMHTRAVNLAGKTKLGALAALLSRARLLVSNDTGVSHLADALHVPSVVIFITSDPKRWAPMDRALHRAVGRPVDLVEDDCQRNVQHRLGIKNEHAMGNSERLEKQPLTPTPSEVIQQADELLAEVQYAP